MSEENAEERVSGVPNEVSMEGQTLDSSIQDEDFSELFLCCVCLDLLYKPVVLACGHIACFWCIHRAMDVLESHCPICRHPYNHFPSICQLLHFLIMKMYPIAYKRREKHVLEEEKRDSVFSPQFGGDISKTYTDEGVDILNCQLHLPATSSRTNYSNIDSAANLQASGTVVPSESISLFQYDDNARKVAVGGNHLLLKDVNNETCKQVSVADLQCAACKQLLFQPAVLNCGHVYCQSCITPADGVLQCQACQSLHPIEFPKVCWDLNHFLKEHFPKEYALRKDIVQPKQVHSQLGATQVQNEGVKPSSDISWWIAQKVHAGCGCDYCGVYPIIGERYKCQDCMEQIGFDLCGQCYNTSSKLPGRFNQRHTPDHKFELTPLSMTYNAVFGFFPGHYEDISDGSDGSAYNSTGEIPEPLEDNLEVPYTSGTPETSEDNPTIPHGSNDTAADQEGTHTSN